jgi:3-deoxy-D-manno-octulosonate 8-phosphate phosphatase (KDO 8-P phosphatase)
MNIEEAFIKQGAVFLSSVEEIAAKLNDVHCFVFDWDGVFNNGVKANPSGSPFSEPDSMGLNMLRFSHWLKFGKLPITAIITGENNLTAIDFAKREHLNAVFLNSKNKRKTLTHLADIHALKTEQIAFVFDDILDLNAAQISRLSFCVRRDASPLFNAFVADNELCDYVSGQEGGKHAIREITELIIGLYGNYDETVLNRMEYIGKYEQYIALRNHVTTDIQKFNI